MGNRAHYVIVENGQRTLFYSHWGSVDLTTNLVFGPEFTVEFIRAQLEASSAGIGWTDEVLCEAAAIVDLDRHELLFYTNHHNGIEMHALVLKVLGITWPGWRIRWFYNGLVDVLAHLGEDPSKVTFDLENHVRPFIPSPPEYRPNCLLTVAKGGQTQAFALVNSPAEVLCQIPRAVTAPPLDARIDTCRLPPDAGVHLDADSQTGGVWSLDPLYNALEWGSATSAGWRLEMWEDQIQRQIELTNGAVRLPEPNPDKARVELQSAVDDLCSDNPVGQAMEVLAPVARMAGDQSINPLVQAHHVSQPTQSAYATVITAIAATA